MIHRLTQSTQSLHAKDSQVYSEYMVAKSLYGISTEFLYVGMKVFSNASLRDMKLLPYLPLMFRFFSFLPIKNFRQQNIPVQNKKNNIKNEASGEPETMNE